MNDKIMICYSDAGNGPISASFALAELLQLRAKMPIEVLAIDVLEKTNKMGYQVVKTYNYLLRHNLFWNTIGLRLFYNSSLVSSGKLLSFSLKSMIGILQKDLPAVIAFTNPWIIGYVINAINRISNYKPKLVSVVIDIGTNLPPSWYHEKVDLYVVATEEAKGDLIKFGALADKIRVLGIPISRKFVDELSPMESNSSLLHPLKSGKDPNVLLIGGREGSHNIFPILRCIMDSGISCTLTVLCGKNVKLKQKIINYLATFDQQLPNNTRSKHVNVHGYVDEMFSFMKSADIIITKPGAVTTWEATVLGIPIILDVSSAIMGQEVGNVLFVESNKIGFLAKNIQSIPNLIKLTQLGKNFREVLAKKHKVFGNTSTTYNIADSILGLIK
jgi:UDP-N-acetylglucosamine:LPS N-acetylglucosamine transferase